MAFDGQQHSWFELVNKGCCWHSPKQLCGSSQRPRNVLFKQNKDLHSGLSLSPLGRAGQRWGRSLLRRLPATACRQKNGEITSVHHTSYKKTTQKLAQNTWTHLTWLKEAISVTSNVMITTGERENKRDYNINPDDILSCFCSQWWIFYLALLCSR